MGMFNAVQTGGMVSAPLIGGLAGAIDWRVAFVASAVVGVLLALAPAPGVARRASHLGTVRLRAAMTRRTAWTSLAAFASFMTVTGLGFLVAIRAADSFGLGPTARGLLLASLGAAGVLAAPPAGHAVDRRGPLPVIATGVAIAAVAVAAMGFIGSAALLAAAWFGAGAGSALVWAGLNTLAVRAAPGNRAGAVSLVGAFKFAGASLSPVALLPLYHVDVRLAFVAAAVVSLGVAAAAAKAVAPARGRA
jgi:MFS family permease